MNDAPDALADIVERARAGETPTETVRAFLARFGAHRRGSSIVSEIRRALKQANLVTVPDCEIVYIDSEIALQDVRKDKVDTGHGSEARASTNADAIESSSDASGALLYDPVPRIGQLEAANRQDTLTDADLARLRETAKLLAQMAG